MIVSLNQIREKVVFPLVLKEATGSGYSDEHATANLWNHVVGHPKMAHLLKHPDHIREEITKASKDKKHPLHFANAVGGFTGGVKKPEHQESYYNELMAAAHVIHGLGNHPGMKKAVSGTARAEVTGAARGVLSDTWNKSGAKDKTSKADVVIRHKNGDVFPISLKKGDSQLMSAQPEEFAATYDHATNEHRAVNKRFTAEHKKTVMAKVTKIQGHLRAMATATSDEEKVRLRDKAQKIMDAVHDEHPGLLKHVHYEASTGEGKFGGQGATGTARFLVTSLKGGGAHIHDVETNQEPIVAGRPRIALPKGRGRPGNVKVDYKAIKKTKAPKA